MSTHPDTSYPFDICLLLRAHGEQLWLNAQIVPVLRELERAESIPEDELGAALAYLEVLWIDASNRAADTEAAFELLLCTSGACDRLLNGEARRYHQAVRALREIAARRVEQLMALPRADAEHEPAYP